ncbi:MAG: DNA mismatch repair endonuclease MutL, partial [Pseudomonadota bacterium]
MTERAHHDSPRHIRQLSPQTVNRIAAGEVIERPASVVKELVENALDAGAHAIDVITQAGGLSLIEVRDDGCGMSQSDLERAIQRHATSKLPDDDLMAIASLGFRGEALPSIGSVAWLGIVSAQRAGAGAEIIVDRADEQPVRPAARNRGTTVTVRDLFSATPARLKFMKSERAENAAIADHLRRLALAYPDVSFTLTTGERAGIKYLAVTTGAAGTTVSAPDEYCPVLSARLRAVLGRDFSDDALSLVAERDAARLTGSIGLPTANRATSGHQYFFVNGRPVRDRQLLSAVRAAYGDTVPKGRHPVGALFLSLPSGDVDVNVHPTKAEVRFRDPGHIRGLIIGSIRERLAGCTTGAQADSGRAHDALARFRHGQGAKLAAGGIQGAQDNNSPAGASPRAVHGSGRAGGGLRGTLEATLAAGSAGTAHGLAEPPQTMLHALGGPVAWVLGDGFSPSQDTARAPNPSSTMPDAPPSPQRAAAQPQSSA